MKKVNDVMRLQALVDRKKVIITEATIREALQLDDAESIDCLPDEEIFTKLSRMGVGKGFSRVETPLFEGMLVAQQADDVADEGAVGVDVDVVPAAAVEPFTPSPTPTTQPPPPSQELPSTSQVIPTPPPLPIAEPSSPPQQQKPSQPTHDVEISLDLLHTLLETYATLTRKVEALEQDKVAQAFEIIKLNQKVKKLERKNKLKVSGLRRLRKVGTAQRVESSADTVMDDQEDASKQREIIANIDANEDVILKDVAADDELEPAELKEVVEVATAKLMTEVVIAASATITAAATPITAVTLNVASTFLKKSKEQLEEEEASRALKRASESQAEKAAKKQKLDEEVPVVDYEIHTENNKPYYKIIRADGSSQLFLSFLSLLRNFDREYLEVLWQLAKERFASSKPKNFSDDFLLTTLTYMFEKPDVQAQVWKNQRIVRGLAKVKSWRLLESCGVHIITFTTTQMILLVERRYPLIRFTLDQMLNNVILEVKEESEVSFELLRFVRRQQQEGFRPE
uniref:Synaptobrevin, longin-like domain protein n=1 Tax=Tanacetum cinerariifolium TaxID=118510 RepID=A0A699IQA8_TANCI|nr:hypothetical protein [Tanacetum cinerariifolium]